MEKLFMLLAFVWYFSFCNAQDKLITQSGDVKIVYNVEVSANKVFYTLENKKDAPIQQITKQDVLTIIHQDGSKEMFGTNETSNATVVSSQVSSTTSSPETANHPIVVQDKEYVPTKFIDKNENKEAKVYFAECRLKNGSVIEDDNVKINYKIDYSDSYYFDNWDIALQISIQNKTNKTIYIDLGNTFITRGTEAAPYYIPKATSSTNGKNGGVGVNVGSVTGALGIGGVVGGIANGVNVGGGSSSSETTTIYSQRVIAISPLSQKHLENVPLFPINSHYNECLDVVGDIKSSRVNIKSQDVKIGENVVFNEENSPVNFSFYTIYSFNEDTSHSFSLHANFYVNQLIGVHCHPSANGAYVSKLLDKELSDNWKNRLFFILGKSK